MDSMEVEQGPVEAGLVLGSKTTALVNMHVRMAAADTAKKRHLQNEEFYFLDCPQLPFTRQLLKQLLADTFPTTSAITVIMKVGDVGVCLKQFQEERLGIQTMNKAITLRMHSKLSAQHYVRRGPAPPAACYSAPASAAGWLVWFPVGDPQHLDAWLVGQVALKAQPASVPPVSATRSTGITAATLFSSTNDEQRTNRASTGDAVTAAGTSTGAEKAADAQRTDVQADIGAPTASASVLPGAGGAGTAPGPAGSSAPAQTAAPAVLSSVPPASSGATFLAPPATGQPWHATAGNTGSIGAAGLQPYSSAKRSSSQGGFTQSQGDGTPLVDVLDSMDKIDAAAMLGSAPSGCRDLLDLLLDPEERAGGTGGSATGLMAWDLAPAGGVPTATQQPPVPAATAAATAEALPKAEAAASPAEPRPQVAAEAATTQDASSKAEGVEATAAVVGRAIAELVDAVGPTVEVQVKGEVRVLPGGASSGRKEPAVDGMETAPAVVWPGSSTAAAATIDEQGFKAKKGSSKSAEGGPGKVKGQGGRAVARPEAKGGPQWLRPALSRPAQQAWLPVRRFDTFEVVWAPVSSLAWWQPAPQGLAALQAASRVAPDSPAAAPEAADRAQKDGVAGERRSKGDAAKSTQGGTKSVEARTGVKRAAATEPEGGAGTQRKLAKGSLVVQRGQAARVASVKPLDGKAAAAADTASPKWHGVSNSDAQSPGRRPLAGGMVTPAAVGDAKTVSGGGASAPRTVNGTLIFPANCQEAEKFKKGILKNLLTMRPNATAADVDRHLERIQVKPRPGSSTTDKAFIVPSSSHKPRSYVEAAKAILELMESEEPAQKASDPGADAGRKMTQTKPAVSPRAGTKAAVAGGGAEKCKSELTGQMSDKSKGRPAAAKPGRSGQTGTAAAAAGDKAAAAVGKKASMNRQAGDAHDDNQPIQGEADAATRKSAGTTPRVGRRLLAAAAAAMKPEEKGSPLANKRPGRQRVGQQRQGQQQQSGPQRPEQQQQQQEQEEQRGKTRKRRRSSAEPSSGPSSEENADSDAPTTAHVDIVPPRDLNPRRACAKRLASLTEQEVEHTETDGQGHRGARQGGRDGSQGDTGQGRSSPEVMVLDEVEPVSQNLSALPMVVASGSPAPGRGRGQGRGRGGRGGGRGRGRSLAGSQPAAMLAVAAQASQAAASIQPLPAMQAANTGAAAAAAPSSSKTAGGSRDVLRAVLQHLSDVMDLVHATPLTASTSGAVADMAGASGRMHEVKCLVAAVLGALLSPGMLTHAGVAALLRTLVDDRDGEQPQAAPAAGGTSVAAGLAAAAATSATAINLHQVMRLAGCVSLLTDQELQTCATELSPDLSGHDQATADRVAAQCQLRAQLLLWAAAAMVEVHAAQPSGPPLTINEVLKLTAAEAELTRRAGVPVEQPMQLLLPVYRQVQRQGSTLVIVAAMVARSKAGQVVGSADVSEQDPLQAGLVQGLVSLASAALGTASPSPSSTCAGHHSAGTQVAGASSAEPATAPFSALRAAIQVALQGFRQGGDQSQQGAVVPPEVALALGDAVALAKQKLQQADSSGAQPEQLEGLDVAGLQAGIALHDANCIGRPALVEGIADVLLLQRCQHWKLPAPAAVAAVAAGHVPSSRPGQVVLALMRQAYQLTSTV